MCSPFTDKTLSTSGIFALNDAYMLWTYSCESSKGTVEKRKSEDERIFLVRSQYFYEFLNSINTNIFDSTERDLTGCIIYLINAKVDWQLGQQCLLSAMVSCYILYKT